MGRTVDQEVHAAFVEFRAKEDDKARDPCICILVYFTKQNTAKHTNKLRLGSMNID